MLIFLSVLAFADTPAVDCQSFNPGSAITSCEEIDICCDHEECWVEVFDGYRYHDPDTILDLSCDFDEEVPAPLLYTFNVAGVVFPYDGLVTGNRFQDPWIEMMPLE